MREKYGIESDRYCYPDTRILKNRLGLQDEAALAEAERDLTAEAAERLEFLPPPYGLETIRSIHRDLFSCVYSWAGEFRSVDISKGETRFCTASRIEPETERFFHILRKLSWLEGSSREELVHKTAELFGDFNVIHPFREGNGRAQRILFENLIINVGFEISWAGLDRAEWIHANVAAYHVDYAPLQRLLNRCIGGPIEFNLG